MTGLFGGTFNPPHIGHMILAEQSLGALSLDK
ncbi:MAG: nicotinate-nucleotide adenylyltransferase, partial [Elusimicrobia bacterium CG_4_10_14_3_um_filter_49_12_50_7]